MPTPAEVLQDPNFHQLPEGERLKVMRTLDANFAGLPEPEQLKVVASPQAAAPAAKPTPGDMLKDVAGGLGETLNPVNIVSGAAGALAHPIDTAKRLYGDNGKLWDQAREAYDKGDYENAALRAVTSGIGVFLPGVGRKLDQTAEGLLATIDDPNNPGKAHEAMRNLGNVAGIGALSAAPRVVEETTGYARRLAKLKPKTATPAAGGLTADEQAAVSFADKEGIPIPAATRTSNRGVRGAQALAANTPLGSPVARSAMAKTETAMRRTAEDIAGQANKDVNVTSLGTTTHPGLPQSLESAGAAVKAGIERRVSRLKGEADSAYTRFRNIEAEPANLKRITVGKKIETTKMVDPATGQPMTREVPITRDVPLPVDVRGVKAELRPIYDDITKWMEPARRSASSGVQAIKSILDGDDYLPASQAEKGLGGLKELARVDNADLRNVSQAIGAKAVSGLQTAIDDAVSNSKTPGALQALVEGRAAHASKMEVADVLKRVRDEPVQAFNQMVWQQDTGIAMLRKVRDYAPLEMPKVGRAFVQDLFDRVVPEGGGIKETKGALNAWAKMGPETKRILYPDPFLRKRVGDFLTLANRLADNPNPSGTATVGQLVPTGVLLATNPVAGTATLLSGAAVAKLLYSPKGARLLTEAISTPMKSFKAAAIGRALLDYIGAAVKISAVADTRVPAVVQDDKPADSAKK